MSKAEKAQTMSQLRVSSFSHQQIQVFGISHNPFESNYVLIELGGTEEPLQERKIPSDC
jgi:hypothetical protein